MLRSIPQRCWGFRVIVSRHQNSFRRCMPSVAQTSIRFSSSLRADDNANVLPERNAAKVVSKQRIENQKNLLMEDNDPDTFGTLSNEEEERTSKTTFEKMKDMDLEDDSEDEHHIRLSEFGRKHPPIWYGRRIEKLAKQGKIYEAIDVVKTTMLKDDRVMPTPYVFGCLIGALGRNGFSYEAFKWYNRMKKMGVEPDGPIYTGLFNACANSPFKDDGLQRAKRLYQQLKEKEVELNVRTYNAIIKAYGVCGDILLAFSVVDEMLQERVKPTTRTYTSLLMACIADKDAGLKHAIEVWRRYRKRRGIFETFHYNLLLRAARDCGVGEVEFAQELIRQGQVETEHLKLGTGSEGNHRLTAPETNHKGWWNYDIATLVPKPVDSSVPEPVSEPMVAISNENISMLDAQVPNILNPKGKFRDVVQLDNLDSGISRLSLLGGVPGMLSHMKKDGAKPDIRTFTLFLDMIPSTRVAEEDLLNSMQAQGVQLDIDILNLIIRRRNLRKDYDGVRAILDIVSDLKLVPNLQTFGCLAMGCKKLKDAKQLLCDMENLALIPNVEICNILSYQARLDFAYRLMLLNLTKKYEIKPEKLFIQRMESAIALAKNILVQLDRDEIQWEKHREERFRLNFKRFMLAYKPWLLETGLSVDIHPWEQFRKPSPTDDDDDDDDDSINDTVQK